MDGDEEAAAGGGAVMDSGGGDGLMRFPPRTTSARSSTASTAAQGSSPPFIGPRSSSIAERNDEDNLANDDADNDERHPLYADAGDDHDVGEVDADDMMNMEGTEDLNIDFHYLHTHHHELMEELRVNAGESTDEQRQERNRERLELLLWHIAVDFQQSTKKWIMPVVMTLSVLAVAGVVAGFGALNFKEGKRMLAMDVVTQPPDGKGAVTVFPAVTRPDPQSCIAFPNQVSAVNLKTTPSMTLTLSFQPCGDLALPQDNNDTTLRDTILMSHDDNQFLLSDDVVMQFDNALTASFNRGMLMSDQMLTLRFASGDLNQYPFDYHHTNSIRLVALRNLTVFDAMNGGEGVNDGTVQKSLQPRRVPLSLSLSGSMLTFSVDVLHNTDISESSNGTLLSFQLQVGRSLSTRAFSVLVMLFMWALSLAVTGVSITVWSVWKKVEPAIIPVSLGLLFALPAIREAQSSIPPIGCTSDVLSFFWCMLLTSMACIALLSNYIHFSQNPMNIAAGASAELQRRKSISK